MTLIAAFRCDGGVILCADSQETVGDYRVKVKKIEPAATGVYQAVIGGAGHGPLIDGFIERLRDELANWTGGLKPPDLKRNIRKILLDYHRNEVAVTPIKRKDKEIRFIICARDASTGCVHLWETRGATLKTIERYSLIGFEDAIYTHEVDRLYRSNAPILRCILLGIHLFVLAKTTSNWISGPTQIIGVLDTLKWTTMHPKIRRVYELLTKSVWVEDTQRIDELEQRMTTLDTAMSELLLDCADTTIHSKVFAEHLDKFKERMLDLRDGYIRKAMYSDIASMKASIGQPVVPGSLPSYLQYSGEVVSLRENDPLTELVNLLDKDTAKPDTATPQAEPSASQTSEPEVKIEKPRL